MRERTARGLLCALALCCLGVAAPGIVHADEEFEVGATIEPRDIVVAGKTFQLVIEVKGASRPGLSVVAFPTLENLRVIRRSFPGTGTYIVNNRVTHSARETYQLVAEKPGDAVIPPIELQVNGETYRTDPIRFKVVEGEGTGVFLRARLSDGEAYVGQPLNLVVEFVTGVGIAGYNLNQSEALSNFWVEREEIDPNREAYFEQVDGKRYTVHPVERLVILPTGEGAFTIDPFTATVRLASRSRSLLGSLLPEVGKTIALRSEPLKLNVRSLPAEGRPAGFTGAVGSFTMRASLDRTEASVDDAVALRVTVQGEGSLRPVKAPELNAVPDLKLFEPRVEESQQIRDGVLTSAKTWEWLLVPLNSGEVPVPEVRFSHFDPEREAYVEQVEDGLVLSVGRGDDRGDRVAGGRLRPQRREIEFIKPRRGDLAESTVRIHRKSWYLFLVFLPLGLVPATIAAGRWHARRHRDQGQVRSRRARSKARRRLGGVEKKIRSRESGQFHEEIARALVEFVADRFDRSAAGMTYDLADDLLASRNVPHELRHRFRACLESCDFARFVPSSGEQERRADTLSLARKLVDDLEKAL